MGTYSKTSLDILRAVKAQPECSMTEISERMGRRPHLQYAASLVNRGLVRVTKQAERPAFNGSKRLMNLHSITYAGIKLLRQMDEAEKALKQKQKQKVYDRLPTIKAAVAQAPAPAAHAVTACSVAAKREAVEAYKPYKAPEQTGRGYTPRPLRSVANM